MLLTQFRLYFPIHPFHSAACAALVTKYIFGVTNKDNPVTQETVGNPLSHDSEMKEGDEKKEAEPEQPAEEGLEVTPSSKAD